MEKKEKKNKEHGRWYNLKVGAKITILLVVVVTILFTIVNVVFGNILANTLESDAIATYTSEAERGAIITEAKLRENLFPLQSLADYIPVLYNTEDTSESEVVEEVVTEEIETPLDTTEEDMTNSENTVDETVDEDAENTENTENAEDITEEEMTDSENTDETNIEESEDEVEEMIMPQMVSAITGESFEKGQIEVEDYIINSLVGDMTSLDDVKTIDAYLEPGILSDESTGYGIIIDTTGNYTAETEYSVYSNETFYEEVKNSGEIYISNTFKDEDGDYVITLAVPILDSGEFMGVLKLNLKTSSLAAIEITATGDASAFSSVYSQDMTMLYTVDDFDSLYESSVYDYVKSQEEDQEISEKIAVEQAFYILSTDMDGEEIYRFFSPINVDDEILWSSVGLCNSDLKATIFSAVSKTTIVSIFAVIICMLLGRLIIKYTKMLNKLQENANKIIAGELDVHGEVKSADEIGKLTEAFNNMSDMLNDIISEISENLELLASGDMSQDVKNPEKYVGKFRTIYDALSKITSDMNMTFTGMKQVAEQVESGSEQVSNASQNLAQGSTEQAASIQELVNRINFVADDTKMNSEYSKVGKESADESKLAIEDINKKLEDLTKSMNKINQKSEEINNIIKAIDSIAFQTNILALNAAVEASRAGEAGKGFAVVADEVRNLAAKSKEAATSTSSLIEEINLSIREGIDNVNDTNKSMGKVVEVSNILIENVEKISKSSEGQLQKINEVLQSAGEISSVVQSNAATSEETAAASDELENEAINLAKAIERFKTK